MAQERIVEETPFPLYFERFIDERDRRFIAELEHLGTRIQHNAGRIDDLRQEMEHRFAEARDERRAIRQEMERRFAEARDERQAIRQEMERRFTDLRQELERRFTEARDDRRAMREEIGHLRDDMNSHFRWTIGFMIPIALGILAIIIRVFFFGFGPTP